MLHTPNIQEPAQSRASVRVLSLWHGDMTRRLPCGVGYKPRALIAAEVADRFGMTVAELMQPTAARRVSWPRMVAMAEMHATGWSFSRCVHFFGLKNHTTARYAFLRVLAGELHQAAVAAATVGGPQWTAQPIER